MSTHLYDERLTTWHSLYRVLVLHFVFETRHLERTPEHDLQGSHVGPLSRSDLKDLYHHRSTQTSSPTRTTKVIPDAIRQRSSLIQIAYKHQRRFMYTCTASVPIAHHIIGPRFASASNGSSPDPTLQHAASPNTWSCWSAYITSTRRPIHHTTRQERPEDCHPSLYMQGATCTLPSRQPGCGFCM